MANFDQLKQSVAALIRTNGAEEITGQIMQDVLLTIINSISGGYMFGGVAQHNGNVGNPDYNVFYLAGSGAYTGYGGAITIEAGCYGVFRYNGVWTQEVVDIGVRLSGSIAPGETRGVTGDTINTALQTLFENVLNILDTLTFTYNTPSAQQATKAMLDVVMAPTGGAPHVFATLTLASATVAAAGLMSAEDKKKVDRMLTDFRSLSLTDTTAAADQATKIVQTLSATLGENPEAITTFTLMAATASKAGLMSAADKSYLDSLPAVITDINVAISDNLARVLAMMGYYECSTAAGTAAKEVSASGYSLTSGGCIRIKMANANTADNVTLNINGTGAKALYYDGAQASSSNTWEAGEVLEVYYDGTQYQCASGGGGKFATGEAVKDVSIIDGMSNNHTDIVSGKALYDMFTRSERTITQADATLTNTILKSNGWTQTFDGYITSPAIPLNGADTIEATGLQYWSSSYMGFGIYSNTNAVLYVNEGSSIIVNLADYPSASYIRFCCASDATNVSIKLKKNAGIEEITAKHVEKGNQMPISSDAVFEDIWSKFVSQTAEYTADNAGMILKANGTTQAQSGYSVSVYVPVDTSCVLTTSNLFQNGSTYHGLHFYDENKASSSVQPPDGGVYTVNMADYPTVKFIRFCGQTADNPKVTVKSGVDLLDEIEETIPKVDEMSTLFDITSEELGLVAGIALSNSLTDNATTPNSAVTKSGVIKTIKVNVASAGKCHIGVGKLDQSLIPVLSKEFEVDLPSAGINEIDVSDKKIEILNGEQIFYVRRTGDVMIRYGISSDPNDAENSCPFGQLSGMNYYGVSGKYLLVTLTYTVMYIDSLFALQSEVNIMQERINALEANSFVYDNQGNPYKLRIVDGDVVALPQVFSNVVVLGNSLTCAPYRTDIGWYGDDRSMCATTDESAWTYLLQRILRQKSAGAVVSGVLMGDWERAGDGNRNINNLPAVKALLDAKLSANTDLIIYRTGENGTVNDSEIYKQEILNLIDYCLATATTATVVMCGMFWPNAKKDAAILAAANQRGYTYITAGRGFSDYQEINGDFMVDSLDGEEKRIGYACISHTADHGYYLWANHVAKNIGYSSYLLDELHTITINSTLQNGYKIKDKQSPYASLVTILVYESSQPSISVVDGNGNTVSTSVHSISNLGSYTFAFTFIQPDSDVTVTLS